MDRCPDLPTVAGQVLVDAVVDDLPDQVVQARAVVNIADVHPRALANRLEAFENRDVLGTVGRLGGTLRNGGGGVASVIRMSRYSLSLDPPFSRCENVAVRREPPRFPRSSNGSNRGAESRLLGFRRSEKEGDLGSLSNAGIVTFVGSSRKDFRAYFPSSFL